MANAFDQFDAAQKPAASANPFDQFDAASQDKPSFLGDMANNASNAVQSAKDLYNGDYQDFGRSVPGVKGQALADKLFPQGSDGSLMGALHNVGNLSPSDVSGALLEKFGQTPEGKALNVMGGIIPSWNAVGTAVSHYANPAIEDATGIAPDNLQLAEMLAGTAGLRSAKNVKTPDLTIAKTAGGKIADAVTLEPKPTITADTLATASKANYDAMANAGASLNRSGMNTVTYNIGKSLDDSGLMNNSLHGDTMSVVADMNKDAQAGTMTLEKLDQYRQLLNQTVKKNTSKIDGANPDAFKANVAITALDDAVNGLGPQHLSSGGTAAVDSLNTARDLYAAKSRMSTVSNIIDNANLTDNPASSLKTGFRNLAKSLRVNPRGWSAEEIAAINHAADTGIATGVLRVAGSRLGPLIAGGAGWASGGPVGAALAGGAEYMISGVARKGATALQNSRANAVLNEIANRPQVQSALNPKAAPVAPATPAPTIAQIMRMAPAQANAALLKMSTQKNK